MRILMAGTALIAMAACTPPIPDSGAGVGFDNAVNNPEAQLRREQELAGESPLPSAQAISDETLSTLEATNTTPAAAPTAAPVVTPTSGGGAVAGGELNAAPSNPAPAVIDNPGISDENDFSAVEGRRDIDSDADRIAKNREQYKVIEATALPKRPGTNRPNIVVYAVQTDNPVGTRLYKRIGIAATSRFERNCAKFISNDKAQEEFLARGGPQRDRLGIDPDGDGYACKWDPTPFRIN